MRIAITIFIVFIVSTILPAQDYTQSSIFAHNDYVQSVPFHSAYQQQVGYIEADVFLDKGNLYVAHTYQEIKKENVLEELYLRPLQKEILKNKGYAYKDTSKHLVLMIDLKTEAGPTLDLLVKKLREYPQLINSSTFKTSISGNTPDPADWKNYPDYIYFDGRPGIRYSETELERISMISTNFQTYSQWNGKGVLTQADEEKIINVIREAHSQKKKIRFWAMPDFNNAWMEFMKLGVDVLNTDNVTGLARFLNDFDKNTYHNQFPHQVYQSKGRSSVQAKKPKNIILLIGDGMGLTQLYSGFMANQGKLNIFNIKEIGFSVTTAADTDITDSAAGATAMATGRKTNNRHVGIDSAGNHLVSITKKLKQQNFRTAIISSGDVTDATPASFYAHQRERSMSEAIALDFLSSDLDILIGGGAKSFINRKDGRNLFTELSKKGYFVSESFSSLESIDSNRLVLLDSIASSSQKTGRGNFLAKSLLKSLTLLTEDEKPFFIMAEGAQIDWGGHQNDMGYVVREVLDFDKAVGEVMKFVDENKETLLIVTADHETGGLSLLGGDIEKGSVYGNFSTTDHSAVMVPVFAYGPGAELFKGVYQNTALYDKILEVLKSSEKNSSTLPLND